MWERVRRHRLHDYVHVIGHDDKVAQVVAVAVEMEEGRCDECGVCRLREEAGAAAGVEVVVEGSECIRIVDTAEFGEAGQRGKRQ